MKYTILFDFDDSAPYRQYAGEYKGALGFAPTLDTALIWVDRATAERILVNGYGEMGKQYGTVIEVD